MRLTPVIVLMLAACTPDPTVDAGPTESTDLPAASDAEVVTPPPDLGPADVVDDVQADVPPLDVADVVDAVDVPPDVPVEDAPDVPIVDVPDVPDTPIVPDAPEPPDVPDVPSDPCAVLDCASDNPCKIGICDPGLGKCVLLPKIDGAHCDDSNLCTVNDKCKGAVCVGVETDCDDGADCTADQCNEDEGCVYLPFDCCGNGTLEATEQCDDENTEDGDGCNVNCQIEPTMTYNPDFTVQDFDVAADGSLFAAGLNIFDGTDKLWAQCWAPDGTLVKDKFVNFDGAGFSAQKTYVARSWTSGNTATASFAYLAPFGAPDFAQKARIIFRLYDAACDPLTQSFPVTTATASDKWDLAIDQTGRAVLVWTEISPCLDCPGAVEQTSFAVFDEAGKPVVNKVFGPGVCTGFGAHVAMNEATGDFVLTCQGDASSPIWYQRFDKQAEPLDAEPQLVEHSESGSADGDTHVVGMHTDGRFAVVWVDDAQAYFEGTMHAADGTLIKHSLLGKIVFGEASNMMAGFNMKLQSPDGDWVLPWADLPEYGFRHFVRYGAEGNLIALGDVFYSLASLTTDATGSTYVASTAIAPILKDVVSLFASAGDGM